MYFLTFNDAHFADVAPESRLDEDYSGSILAKLDQIVKVVKKLNAKAIINAGDLFHIKTASRNSHAMMQRLMKQLREVPVLSIAGNHDIAMDRLDTLSRQPLGDLIESGVTEHIHLSPRIYEDNGSRVKVVGVSYAPNLSEYADAEELKRGDCDRVILALHCSASPKGGDFFGEAVFSYSQLKDMFPEVDVFVLGHLHFYTGIHKVKDAHFINIGALTRCSLHLDNLQRKVQAGLIKIAKDGVVCKGLELRVHPAESVLSVERHEAAKEERKQIDQFIQSLATEGVESGHSDAVRDYLDRSDLPMTVRVKALYLLEEAGLEKQNA